jgi:hypothetical protein
MADFISLATLATLACIAPAVTWWQFRLKRQVASVSPEAYSALRFDRVGGWPGWNMARARNAFNSPEVAKLPPHTIQSVQRYVIAEAAYICFFALTFCIFVFRSV